MSIFWFFLILIIVTVALFTHFRQEARERNKLITLILLSIPTALLLASLSLLASDNLIKLVWVVPTQLILIIPFTLIVYFIYYLIYKGNHSINIIYRIIIPLAFNIIGGSTVLIVAAGFIAKPALDAFSHRDVIVTIKNETFILGVQETLPIYRVSLNVNNPSQREISQMHFELVTSKQMESTHYDSDAVLGLADFRQTIPAGESDIVVDLPIFGKCKDANLDKPLYLIYTTGYAVKTLEVNNSINQKILETICQSTP